MKQVVLRIDDAAFEKFMGMVSLCPQVEIVDVDESAVPTQLLCLQLKKLPMSAEHALEKVSF